MSNRVTCSEPVHVLPPGSKHSSTCTREYIYNKLEVGSLDPRLSSFVIISSYIHTLSWCQRVVRSSRNRENLAAIKLINKFDTLSWCQIVVRIQIAFKTIQTENWEIESKEDHLTVIKLRKHTS